MNLSHYKLLRTGVIHWNKWRSENLVKKPDLSHTDLSHSPLYNNVEDPFSNYLSRANFRATNFAGSNLTDVLLAGCDFSFANLTDANLANTDLSGSIFRNAVILGTKLDYASVDDVDFSGAILGRIHIVGVDLSAASGLNSATYKSSITLDESSLKKTAAGLAKHSRNLGPIRIFLEKSGNLSLVLELETAIRVARSGAVPSAQRQTPG